MFSHVHLFFEILQKQYIYKIIFLKEDSKNYKFQSYKVLILSCLPITKTTFFDISSHTGR